MGKYDGEPWKTEPDIWITFCELMFQVNRYSFVKCEDLFKITQELISPYRYFKAGYLAGNKTKIEQKFHGYEGSLK